MNYLKHLFLFVFAVLWICTYCTAQLSDDFSDSDITANPVWQGDVVNFMVDEDLRLMLNAPGAGNSQLYTAVSFPDSIQWDFWFNLEFDPSTGNFLRIYLQADNSDLSMANGYYLEIGESGSSDAVELYRQDGANNTLLARSDISAVISSEVNMRVRITRNSQGSWTFASDPTGGNAILSELNFTDNTYPGGSDGFFGIDCTYTSSRASLFFFDDISIQLFSPDLTAPELISASATSNSNLLVRFSEPIEESSSLAVGNYSVNQGIGNPISVSQTSANEVELMFSNDFVNLTEYILTVSDIEDISGNVLSSENISFSFLQADEFEQGDLILSEILFNPVTDGFDFVELQNVSNKVISLSDVFIGNIDEDDSVIIGNYPDHLISPGVHVALTENRNDIIERYEVADPDNLVEVDIPSFSNSSGNVSIVNRDGIIFETFDYNEDFHSRLIDDVNGISLERLSSALTANSSSSWHSASTLVRATPTGANSQMTGNFEGTEILNINEEFKVFSPDNDGFKDFTLIQLNPPGEGYIGTINIYDSRGRKVKDLLQSAVLGLNNTIQWDGITNDNLPGELGIYVVWAEIFNTSGDKQTSKETIVLARRLD